MWYFCAWNVDKMRQYMALKMVYLHKRNIICYGQPFGKGHAYQQ